MDERTLDGVARAAGILRNKVAPGEAVVMAGLTEEDADLVAITPAGMEMDCHPTRAIGVIGNLHEFGKDVQDLVAWARKALAREARILNFMEAVTLSVSTDDVIMLAEEFADDAEGFRLCGPGPDFGGVGHLDAERN